MNEFQEVVAPPARARVGFWLFAAHVASVVSLAASNVLLATTAFTLPWTLDRPLPGFDRETWRWLGALALYFGLLAVSVVFSYDPAVSAVALREGFNLATPVLALLLVRRELEARRLVGQVILMALALALAGLVQFSLGSQDLDSRIRGFFSHYMTFAGVLLLSQCVLLAWMAAGSGWRRWWAWLAVVAIPLALLGSFTRNAWVALLVVVTVLVVVRAPKLLLAYLPVAVLVALLAPEPLLNRFTSIFDLRDVSNYDRLCMASASLHMVAERPLFGIGPKMVAHRYALYREPTAPRVWVPHLHNSFLNIAAERGLTSLLAFLAILGLSARRAWRRLELEGGLGGPRADLYLGVLLAILAFSVAGLFEDNWADTEVQRIMLFLLALPFALPTAERGRREPEASGGPESLGAVV